MLLAARFTPVTWYLISVTTFVVPLGIQTVLFPWLIAIELQLGASELGLGQMALQLPALLLILIGGFLADRFDVRAMLVILHIVAIVPPLLLAWLIFNDQLAFGWMIIFALGMGTVTAFSQPARDKLVNIVAGDQIQRTVTVVMGLTFGTQIIGFALASTAETVGATPLLILMAIILVSGTFATAQLPDTPGTPDPGVSMGTAIIDGLRIVLRAEKLRASAILLGSISMFYGGTFVVLNPLMVRDIYAGGAQEISISFALFMSGTVLTTVMLVALGGVKKPGKAMMIAVVLGGVMLAFASLGLSFYGYLACLFGWGCCGGVAMSMGRTIMQENAPESHRGRVMSVLSLANVGALPFGAAMMGFCAEYFGVLNSYLVAVTGAWLAVLYVATRAKID